MTSFIRLALESAWNRRLSLGLTLLSIVLAASLLVSIERLREAARDGFAQSVSGVDLLVGARGSSLALTLYSVFHLGEAVNNVEWTSYEKLAAHPLVAWSIPLSLGDSHRGLPVLGTTSAYFEHFGYGDRQSLRFAAGRPFSGLFEAVLGSEAAARLGYALGDRITLTHGAGASLGGEHADKPFTIVGILAPTGTPVDRTVHVSLAAIEAIHLDWQGGRPLPGFSIPASAVQKFDLKPKTLTAFWLGLKSRAAAFRLQRQIAAFAGEPLMAVLPGVALDQLWQGVGVGERVLRVISWLVLGTSLAGLAAVLFASLSERRRELAILRALGAGPRHLVSLLMLEAGVVSLLGVLASLALVTLAAWWGGPLAAEYGIVRLPLFPSLAECARLAAIPVAAALVSFFPAWLACRRVLAEGLTPRS